MKFLSRPFFFFTTLTLTLILTLSVFAQVTAPPQTTQSAITDPQGLQVGSSYTGYDGREWVVDEAGILVTGGETCADADEDGYWTNTCIDDLADCNDDDANIHSGAQDVCGDGIDQDCSGSDLSCSSQDQDNDGFTGIEGDCDDSDRFINPGAVEICTDSKDNDCDGDIDAADSSCADSDRDGFTIVTGDCNDSDSAVYPTATEICSDSKDNNCDEQINEWCPDLCDVSGDFLGCFVEETATDLSTVFSTALNSLSTSIQNILSGQTYPAGDPAPPSSMVSQFDRLTVLDKASLNPSDSEASSLIKTDSNIGSVFITQNTDESIGLGVSSNGLVGATGIGNTGVLVEPYVSGATSIQPNIGIYAESPSGIGTYSSNGTVVDVKTLGLYSIGEDVGIIAVSGTSTGLVVNNPATSGDIIGAVVDGSQRVWGALGTDGYSLFTPFDAYSKNLEVLGITSADTLETSQLLALLSRATVKRNVYLSSISPGGYLEVRDSLETTGNLTIGGVLDIDGSVYINAGSFQVDGDLSTGNSNPLTFNNSMTIDDDLNVGDGSVTAENGIGRFYQVKGENSLGNPTASCVSGDFLVSCSAKVRDSDLYVGARPKDSDTCEAYAQRSNVTVTVYAYCFDPQGVSTSSL